MRLCEIINTKTMFDYNGTCVKCDIPAFRDATFMSNMIQFSDLLKHEYLHLTNILEVSPKSVLKFINSKKPFVMGYHKNLVWLYFPNVDKHFFYTTDDYLKIAPEYIEHQELDRGI